MNFLSKFIVIQGKNKTFETFVQIERMSQISIEALTPDTVAQDGRNGLTAKKRHEQGLPSPKERKRMNTSLSIWVC